MVCKVAHKDKLQHVQAFLMSMTKVDIDKTPNFKQAQARSP